MFQAGIDGSGQVIGCGDSGVDVYNCLFYDGNVPFTVTLNSYGSQVSWRSGAGRQAGLNRLGVVPVQDCLTPGPCSCGAELRPAGVMEDNCSAVTFLFPLHPCSYTTQAFVSTTHRTLVLYLALQDLVDGNGHGSHVAGAWCSR